MKLYKSINTIPIFNFWKIQITSDYRFLIKDVDIDELPEVKIDKNFYKAFEVIFEGIKNIDFSLQNSYLKSQFLLSIFFATKKETDRTKYNIHFSKYLLILELIGTEFEVNGIKNDNLIVLFKEYKTKTKDYFLKQNFDFDYRRIKYKEKEEWDLEEEAVNLELILKKDIDIFTCSASKYFIYKEKAKKTVENTK